MQKLHMRLAGILCSACVQNAAPPAELSSPRGAPAAPLPQPLVPAAAVFTPTPGEPPVTPNASADHDAGVAPDAGPAPLAEPMQPEPPPEVWPAPPLAREVCAERAVLLEEWAPAPHERATVSIEYEGARLLELNLEGCPFIAPTSGQAWSVTPGTYRLYFTFEANIARRARVTLAPGKQKHIRVTIR